MPGVPSGRGCDACRKAKKRCDQTKPTCLSCKKRGIPCVGNGVKRWKFMTYDAATSGDTSSSSPEAEGEGDTEAVLINTPATTPRPIRCPSNERTRLASALVHVLETQDIRYHVSGLGGQFMADLPRRLGASQLLDTSIAAITASYYAVHHKGARQKALQLYGTSLECLRLTMFEPKQHVTTKIYSIVLISLCQEWVDSLNKETGLHRQMIAHMVRDAVKAGTIKELDKSYLYALCQVLVWEAFVNPKIELEDWIWNLLDSFAGPRPHGYQPHLQFQSLDIETQAETAFYFRNPGQHLYQLRRIYNTAIEERPRIRHMAEQMSMLEAMPAPSREEKKQRVTARITVQIGLGLVIFITSGISKAIRPFDTDPKLVEDMHQMIDEGLLMCPTVVYLRPFGSGFVPKTLKVLWACMPEDDDYRRNELEDWLRYFEVDFEGADYVKESTWMRDRLDIMMRTPL